MLDTLSARLAGIVKHIRGEARLTEANIQEALREVRVALRRSDLSMPVLVEPSAMDRTAAVGCSLFMAVCPGTGRLADGKP